MSNEEVQRLCYQFGLLGMNFAVEAKAKIMYSEFDAIAESGRTKTLLSTAVDEGFVVPLVQRVF